MLFHGSSFALLAALLSSTPSATTSRVPAPIDTEVQIEIVEHAAGKRSNVGFVVPVEGEIAAWVDDHSNARRCELEVDQVLLGIRVKVECSGGAHRSLRIEATRGLTPGKRIRIAEVTRAGGEKSQVFATLR